MARYEYDDFWVEFSPRAGGGYDVAARAPDGATTTGEFVLPFTGERLDEAVRTIGYTRAATTRDIGEVTTERRLTAEQLGGALADALISGPTGDLYLAARSSAVAKGRGVRLWLSLGKTPGLLSVPWEFLYLQPTFLASQRKTPIVRFLRTDAPVAPRRIEKEVRILGVIASPAGLPALKVELERQRVDRELEKARQTREVTVDWLDPATPKALRLKLQEGDYHILHFVGHSGYADDTESADGGGGVIYLENEDHSKAPVSDSQLVNLLGDQDSLRLVVLNSCEGARTSARDPFAGIATSIVALGIPAVVAMQFEISDDAAIAFAEELYGSLIAREETIDVAVAEARKAVFTEVNETEWATPVLFLRNEDGRLFDFVPVVPVPGQEETTPQPKPVPRPWLRLPDGIRPVWLAAGIIPLVIIALLFGGNGLGWFAGTTGSPSSSPGDSIAEASETPSDAAETDTPSNEPTEPVESEPPTIGPIPTVRGTGEWAGPREKAGLLAVAGAQSNTISHLGTVVPTGEASGKPAGVATSLGGVYDTDPTWIQFGGVLGFTRVTGEVSEIQYVVPGVGQRPDGLVDKGITVKDPLNGHPPDGVREHAPAWLPDGNLIFAQTSQCAPQRGCTEDIMRSRLTWSGDFIDGAERPTAVSPGWSDIRHISVGATGESILVVGRNELEGGEVLGIWVVDADDKRTMLTGSDGATFAVFAGDGTFGGLVGGTETGWGPTIYAWASIDASPRAADAFWVLGSFPDRSQLPTAAEAELGWLSLSPLSDGRAAILIADRPGDPDRKPKPTVIGLLDGDLRLAEIVSPAAPEGQTWNDLVALGW